MLTRLRQFSIVPGVLGGVLFFEVRDGRLAVFASFVIGGGPFLIGVAGRP
jgi:hypothetical protein